MFIIGILRKLLRVRNIFGIVAALCGIFGIFYGFSSLAYIALGVSVAGLVFGIIAKKLGKGLITITGFVLAVVGLVSAAVGSGLTFLNGMLWEGLAEKLFNAFL